MRSEYDYENTILCYYKIEFIFFIILIMMSKQLRQRWKEEYSKEWFQFILDNPNKHWEYDWLSENPNITWEIVKNNPQINWSYKYLSENPNAIDLLEHNMAKIDWFWLSGNPNAVHLLEQHMDKINWEFLSNNPNAIQLIENNMGKECIYISNLTRQPEVAFIDKVQYFGGALLMLLPKEDIDLKKVVNYLNSESFKKNFIYSGRFKIGHRQLSNSIFNV